jgi:hypothetical protein
VVSHRCLQHRYLHAQGIKKQLGIQAAIAKDSTQSIQVEIIFKGALQGSFF